MSLRFQVNWTPHKPVSKIPRRAQNGPLPVLSIRTSTLRWAAANSSGSSKLIKNPDEPLVIVLLLIAIPMEFTSAYVRYDRRASRYSAEQFASDLSLPQLCVTTF